MQQWIKVVNPAIVKALTEAGFSYMREGASVFVFATSPEIIALIGKDFSNKDYYFDDRLTF